MNMKSQLDPSVYGRSGSSIGEILGGVQSVMSLTGKARENKVNQKEIDDNEYLNTVFGQHLAGWDKQDRSDFAKRTGAAMNEVLSENPALYKKTASYIADAAKMEREQEDQEFQRQKNELEVESKDIANTSSFIDAKKKAQQFLIDENDLITKFLNVDNEKDYQTGKLYLNGQLGITPNVPDSFDEFYPQKEAFLSKAQIEKQRLEKRLAALDESTKKSQEKIAGVNADYIEREKNQGLRKGEASISKLNREINKENTTNVSPEQFTQENQLRNSFNNLSKTYNVVRDSYSRIDETASGEPSPAGDLSLVFNYMKMLDPGSVVRESEYANAENARGVPESIRNVYNKVAKGHKLTVNQRKDFYDRATSFYTQAQNIQDGLVDQYSETAKSYGLDPKRVTGSIYNYKPKGSNDDGATGVYVTPPQVEDAKRKYGLQY